MRITLVSSLVFLAAAAVAVACGGGPKHAAIDPSDTSSLESGGSSASSSDAPASSSASSGSAPDDSSPGGSPLSSLSSSSKPGAKDSAAPGAAPAAAPVAFHPAPGATGSIDGKPFAPRLAQVVGPLQGDGRLAVILHEGSDCISPGDAKPGDASMTLMVTWQDGYKVDLGSLLRSKGEAAFARVGSDKKSHPTKAFKPTGRLTVVSAPTQQNAFGKLKIDLSSGDYILAGDLDVKVCGALK
jgi:hypothetical protein